MNADAPGFTDLVNPTHDEIRAWAYGSAVEPMKDWDIVIAFPENLDVLVELVADPACVARTHLLGSLYCLVGHVDHDDARLRRAARDAVSSSDEWVSTWGRRACRVLEEPASFERDDWCGWSGRRSSASG